MLITRIAFGRREINPETGRDYRRNLLYPVMAEELWKLRKNKPWVQIGSRLQLVRLAADPGDTGERVEWTYPQYRAPGQVYESGAERPWIGRPGFGLRLHETVVLGIHPDSWSIYIPRGAETMMTRATLRAFGGIEITVSGLRTSARPDVIVHARGESWTLPKNRARVFMDENGHPLVVNERDTPIPFLR